LPRRAHVDELTREQPETAQVAFVMLEDGQRAIDVHDSFVPALDGYSIGDALRSDRGNGKL
jgi:hypothetical protein